MTRQERLEVMTINELNLMLAKRLGHKIIKKFNGFDQHHYLISENRIEKDIPKYCTSAGDTMPLAFKNRLKLTPIINSQYRASVANRFDVCENKNPLRATAAWNSADREEAK